jgi:hypothetical protein
MLIRARISIGELRADMLQRCRVVAISHDCGSRVLYPSRFFSEPLHGTFPRGAWFTGIHGPPGCVGSGDDEHPTSSIALQSTTINFMFCPIAFGSPARKKLRKPTVKLCVCYSAF